MRERGRPIGSEGEDAGTREGIWESRREAVEEGTREGDRRACDHSPGPVGKGITKVMVPRTIKSPTW